MNPKLPSPLLSSSLFGVSLFGVSMLFCFLSTCYTVIRPSRTMALIASMLMSTAFCAISLSFPSCLCASSDPRCRSGNLNSNVYVM